jgi:phospholipid transport system substrate-binding protein
MNRFKIRLSLSAFWIAALMAFVLCGPIPSRAQQLDAAARRIQTYYQELMPTLQQAGRLSVRERDQRFGPAITSAFDLATMTRLATGPAWSSFSGAQQAAVREAFTRFLVADYASEVTDYSSSIRRRARNRAAAAKSSRPSCSSRAAGRCRSITSFAAAG